MTREVSTVTEEQRRLAIEQADNLVILLREGTVSLLTGQSNPAEAIPILDRLLALLKAAGRDTDLALEDALALAAVPLSDAHFPVDEGRINELEMWRGPRPGG